MTSSVAIPKKLRSMAKVELTPNRSPFFGHVTLTLRNPS